MRIFYESSYGEFVYLDRLPYMMLSDTDVFNYEWGYNTQNNKTIYNIKKGVVKNKIKLRIFGSNEHDFYENLNTLERVFDKDTTESRQGKLWFYNDNDEGYFLLCNVITNKKQKFLKKNNSVFEFEILSNGFWINDVFATFYPNTSQVNYGKMYNYGYPYDYAPAHGGISEITNEHYEPVDFKIYIGGYAQNPSIIIGDNLYNVDCEVLDGEFLNIDSKNKTIMLYHNDGREENVFRYRNKEHYIFKKIPVGTNPIIWNGDYTVSIDQFIERSEPKWI